MGGTRVVPLKSEPSATTNAVGGAGDLSEALRRAEVDRAAGLVAGTHDDSRNLSVVAAARILHPGIFVVLRQNHRVNQVLFDAFASDITVFSPEIVVHECLAQLNTPLLQQFLEIVKEQDDAWADATVHKLRSKITRTVPSVWTVELTRSGAPAAASRLLHPDAELRMDHLLRDPSDREQHLRCVPLMVRQRRAKSDDARPGRSTEAGRPDFVCGFSGGGRISGAAAAEFQCAGVCLRWPKCSLRLAMEKACGAATGWGRFRRSGVKLQIGRI